MAWTTKLETALSKPQSLAAELTGRLRDQIVGGALSPGQKLPTEQEIAEAWRVSRTVVREAIAALKSEHLVVTR